MKPKVKVFDNNGKTFDRFTIIDLTPLPDNQGKKILSGEETFIYVGSSHNPRSPQGFWQHGEIKKSDIGKHLGKIIPFESLPIEVQNTWNAEN